MSSLPKQLSSHPHGAMLYLYNSSIATLKLILGTGKRTTLLLVLCSPENLLDIFDVVRKQTLRSHTVKWLLLLQGIEAQTNVILRLEANIFEGTQVLILTKISSEIFYFYSSRSDVFGLTRFDYKGSWNSENITKRKLLLTLITSGDEKHYLNMAGRKLVVSAIESWPFLGLPKSSFNGTTTPPSGMEARILDNLGSTLNFTYEILVPEDKKWGNPQPDGTVTGLMGMVARGEAHLAFPVITDMRAKLIDYTLPFYREPLAIFTRAATEKSRALAVFSPFTTMVWLCIIFSIIVTGPILYILSYTIHTYTEMREKWTLEKYSFAIFRIMVTQGNCLSFRYWPQRLLTFSWSLFCIVISALYSGTLTAVLAIPTFETPIDSLEDLPRAVKDGFAIGVMEDSSNELLFRW
ncbi:glutamate receptor ionotropic, delta-2-like [Palaemon carinicauda]|uniref:glutamate receptor ionotropic, delta-2-like n=1 Tax=Palaemon carinicauda TaxID=392227 RepID=UPI0035B69280